MPAPAWRRLRRRLLREAPPSSRGFPLADLLRGHKLALLRGVGLCLVNAVGFYMIFVYFVTWLRVAVHLPLARALYVNTATMVVALVVIPTTGWLADRFGSRPLLLIGACGLLLLTLPLLALMQSGGIAAILAGEFGFVLLIGCYNGVNPAAVAELYPRAVRCSGVSLAYNLAFGMIGGLTPMIATWLIARTGDPLSPAFYLVGAATLSLATALSLGERAFRSLDAEAA
jgi:MHS family proline/betaine transporter-like MFS transporter